MFSLFPQLLFLTPMAIALLRVAAGVYLIYIGYGLWSEREMLTKERLPIIGHMPVWLSTGAATMQIIVGLLLVVGAWTQLVALIGAITALKCLLFGKAYKKVIPIERSGSLLLLVILLSLVVTGAGAFAFDLPL